MTTATLHPFENAGLGIAPFAYEGMSQKVITAGECTMPGGTCDYCGQGIRYCCHVRSHDGKSFVVGCDCIRKIGREDNRLMTEMERGVAKMEQEKRDAARAAKWAAERERVEAAQQAERDRNGGLTDYEVKAKKEAEESAAREAKFTTENAWLLDVLANAYQGDFVESICGSLKKNSAANVLGGRAYHIIAEIYAKTKGGRKGSKAFKAAEQEFYDRLPEVE